MLGRLPGTRLRNPGLPDQTRSTTIFLLWKNNNRAQRPKTIPTPGEEAEKIGKGGREWRWERASQQPLTGEWQCPRPGDATLEILTRGIMILSLALPGFPSARNYHKLLWRHD